MVNRHEYQWFGVVRVCVVLLLLVQTPLLPAASEKTSSIQGTVNYCGNGGLEGMQVYVPGKPYVIITDKSGKFEFTNLPSGRYSLSYIYLGKVLNNNSDIEVGENKPALLGEIRFCSESVQLAAPQIAPGERPVIDPAMLDKDGDGVVAAQDCRDDDASIRPGAREICDGVDNDCDGKIDNLGVTAVEHGSASCQLGKLKLEQCDKGFSDCDGDISNGCEVNLMTDDANCGSCGHACSLEICSLGSC